MFEFRQFTVDDSRCDMKVGTDSVLLGSWVRLDSPTRVLDAGSGCGILSLMTAQRAPEAYIDAVELSENACGDALKNVHNSPFCNRIHILNKDITKFDFAEGYDLVISNPPFFTEALHSPSAGRAASRHEGVFGVEWLLTNASRLLNPDGSLAFIAPAARDNEIEYLMELSRLNLLRKCSVIPVAGRQAKRTLWQVSEKKLYPAEKSSMTIRHTDQTLTTEYNTLTSDFYL
ncbi:MAG: methyltransferase [Duncaniella sp.]|nr:methyltransferase [Duncaniella sp.]